MRHAQWRFISHISLLLFVNETSDLEPATGRVHEQNLDFCEVFPDYWAGCKAGYVSPD